MVGAISSRFGSNRLYLFGLILLILTSSMLPRTAFSGEEGAEQVIQRISDRLKVVVEQEGDRLKQDPAYLYQLANEILVPHIDFARVSSLALGRHWRQATPAQREAFREQFQRLLVRTYSTAVTELTELKIWELRILSSRVDKEGAETAVRTQLLLPQREPIEVIYRMHAREGKWTAYDVRIEGISLVTNYRSSFNREVRSIGMDGLIKKIAMLNDKRVEKKETKNG